MTTVTTTYTRPITKYSSVKDIRFNRYDQYGSGVFQIPEEYALKINKLATDLNCTHFPAQCFNSRWTIKMKRPPGNLSNKIISGRITVKHWKFDGKSGLSTHVSEIKKDEDLDRYNDIPEFCWEDTSEEL